MEELQIKCLNYEKGLGSLGKIQSNPQDELKTINLTN